MDLFDQLDDPQPKIERLSSGTVLLRRFALGEAERIWAEVQEILQHAPLMTMHTPSGLPMSVTTSSCGRWGWVTDEQGYRYTGINPASGQPWPAMPLVLRQLAKRAAQAAGFAGFEPDACLINCYGVGARMGLHQDRDERDFRQPIVSLSLGMPAVFLLGGLHRHDPQHKLRLVHGDVLVWGGVDRLRFHGVAPVKLDVHPLLGDQRFNLTFRRAR